MQKLSDKQLNFSNTSTDYISAIDIPLYTHTGFTATSIDGAFQEIFNGPFIVNNLTASNFIGTTATIDNLYSNNLSVNELGRLTINGTLTNAGLNILNYSTTSAINYFYSNGTITSPTLVVPDNTLGTINFYGCYSTTNHILAGKILAKSTATFTETTTSAIIFNFYTNNSNTASTEINNNGFIVRSTDTNPYIVLEKIGVGWVKIVFNPTTESVEYIFS